MFLICVVPSSISKAKDTSSYSLHLFYEGISHTYSGASELSLALQRLLATIRFSGSVPVSLRMKQLFSFWKVAGSFVFPQKDVGRTRPRPPFLC